MPAARAAVGQVEESPDLAKVQSGTIERVRMTEGQVVVGDAKALWWE